MKLTKESLEKSLEICEKATPGPWSGFECGSWGDGSYGIAIGENLEDWFSCKQFNLNGSSNALFISHHNPEFIKELIQAHIEALKVLKSYEHISAQPDSEVTRFSAAAEYLSKHGGVE